MGHMRAPGGLSGVAPHEKAGDEPPGRRGVEDRGEASEPQRGAQEATATKPWYVRWFGG
jgi:hypothetical protein